MVTLQLAIMRVMELIIYYINLLCEKCHVSLRIPIKPQNIKDIFFTFLILLEWLMIIQSV